MPKDYPTHTDLPDILPPKGREPGRKFIGPIKITSKGLIAACHFAFLARRIKRWGHDEFHAHLRTCCVNKKMRILVGKLATNDRKMECGKNIDEFMIKCPMCGETNV